MASPPSSPIQELQSHLYKSFLEGIEADVTLHIKGSFEASYDLHRVILTQAVSIHPVYLELISLNHRLGIFQIMFLVWIFGSKA